MTAPPWKLDTGIDNTVEGWMRSGSRHHFVAERALRADTATYAPFPDQLTRGLVQALRGRGIERLYGHQRGAIDAAMAGRHTVIATPTASGKSLCFHLPVLHTLHDDREATALYIYPTKALSRDQEHDLRKLARAAEIGIGAVVYDGDTPGDARRCARDSAAIIMSNPDMLHAGILPQHPRWARFFQKLRYVILDELHTYRGVFGSHVAHVLSRLRRVAQFHGSNPTFICATATIGNPDEHAGRLIGCPTEQITVVDRCTAPRAERRVLIYNPPVVNAELGIRASCIKTAVRYAGDLIQARVRTILFGQSRNSVETMLKYLRDRFRNEPALHDAIVAYRGGYLPGTRRTIESGLRDGQLIGVVATNALELGIDIGDLDAVVCAGYPGSLAETWQRFGRAGRRGAPSIALLIASSAPLDQYLAHHPELLFEGNIERARSDPENTEIIVQHLKCAAFELPFARREAYGGMRPGDTEDALGFLEQHGVLHAANDHYYWATDAFPANHVSLRSIGWDNFVIIDLDTDLTLAELDWHSAPSMLHEQAIYQHDGKQYQVERLDYENHKAYVRHVEPDYFTTALRSTKVSIIEKNAEAPLRQNGHTLAEVHMGWGDVSVVEKIVGYKKVKFHTHENAGYGDVRLPDIQMHTTSFWLTLNETIGRELGRANTIEGLKGLSAALELVATLALMCDPRDLGRAIEDGAVPPSSPGSAAERDGLASPARAFSATAFLFDNVPCGVGLAERIHHDAEALLRRAAEVVAGCSCALGCPSCVGATALSVLDVSPSSRPEQVPGVERKSATVALCQRLRLLPQRLQRGSSFEPAVSRLTMQSSSSP